jgi:hypothetical protein
VRHADQVPVRIDAESVHDDDRVLGRRRGRGEDRKHARVPLRREPDGIADDELRNDLLGPPALARRIRDRGDCAIRE